MGYVYTHASYYVALQVHLGVKFLLPSRFQRNYPEDRGGNKQRYYTKLYAWNSTHLKTQLPSAGPTTLVPSLPFISLARDARLTD